MRTNMTMKMTGAKVLLSRLTCGVGLPLSLSNTLSVTGVLLLEAAGEILRAGAHGEKHQSRRAHGAYRLSLRAMD